MGLTITAMIANTLSKKNQIDVKSVESLGSNFIFYIDNRSKNDFGL